MKNKLKIHKAIWLEYQQVYLDIYANCNGNIYIGRITEKDSEVTCKRCWKKIVKRHKEVITKFKAHEY